MSPSLLHRAQTMFDAIKQRAFALFERRQGAKGSDLEDWLQAERDVTWSLAAKSILMRNPHFYDARLAHPLESGLMRIGRSLPSPMIALLARTLLNTRWFVRKVVLEEWFLHRNSMAIQRAR